MKLVSVIIPVYNVENYIAQTINSVLSQTYTNFEVLIIDDESPDRSIEICQQFNDPRIKIIHQQNRGLAGARNTGIRHAQGDYLAFLDSDDLWLPEKLARHVQHLDSAPQVGVSFSRSQFIDGESQPLGIYQMPKLQDITPSHLLCRNPIGNGSAPVIRKEVFSAICFQDNLYGQIENFYFDENFRQSEDIECWLRIASETSWLIEGIGDALTLYRVNGEGLSANVLKQYDSWSQMIEKHRDRSPELLAQYENPARAFQLRYLARRAVRLKDSKMAVRLTHQALATHWQIILSEPSRTIQTIFAAYLLRLLPLSFYQGCERFALKLTGISQQLHILRDRFTVKFA
ncbi:glycosyltransferase family 2 protein [Waterburya agarophytonicola K14]|uniref:Glycosyltransferase family 2 protein n=1 Tax=Waterburya agarophytonicola KI4 TaxID=2874699 RepID=A0A964BU90_9CYAN|nr:glycosyltransferase family 2 protein [Waterburya agarophytonicola]MCC0179229.1 glycosyltransferase family 2 protein [Waterburya agarophytonicola KI4]